MKGMKTPPQPVTKRERRPCPVCGGELRSSHREYAGSRRSVDVMVCRSCGTQLRGEAREDADRPRALRRTPRPLPAEGPPDNFVLDPSAAEALRQALEAEEPGVAG
jgi:ribosomal protein L37AE/L43A